MVEHESYTNVRIESSTVGKAAVMRMGVLFLFFFVLFFGIGAGGPEVISEYTSVPVPVGFSAADAYAYYAFGFQLSEENQLFWVEGRMTTPDFVGDEAVDDRSVEVDLDMQLTATGNNGIILNKQDLGVRTVTCNYGDDYCSWFDIWSQDFIDWGSVNVLLFIQNPQEWEVITSSGSATILTNPQVNVDFDMQYRLYTVSVQYTKFEMGWKIVFQILTLAVMFMPRYGYVPRLVMVHRADWSFQQRWALALLVILFFFNDPFFPATIYAENGRRALSIWYMFVIAVFIFMLFLFWLCVLDDMKIAARKERREGTQHTVGMGRAGSAARRETHRTKRYWIPKVVITFTVAVICLGSYSYYRYKKENSPEYSGVDDSAGQAEVIGGILAAVMAIYTLWLLYLIAISIFHIDNIPSLGYRFLFYITIVTLVLSLVGVFMAGFYPIQASSVLFLGFYGTYNMYIWILGWAYTPVFGINEHENGEQVIMAGSRRGTVGGHRKAQSSGDMEPVLI